MWLLLFVCLYFESCIHVSSVSYNLSWYYTKTHDMNVSLYPLLPFSPIDDTQCCRYEMQRLWLICSYVFGSLVYFPPRLTNILKCKPNLKSRPFDILLVLISCFFSQSQVLWRTCLTNEFIHDPILHSGCVFCKNVLCK